MQATALSGITAIAGGSYHSLALKDDGTVWVSGDNYYGAFGNGNNNSSNVHVQTNTLTDVIAIAGGGGHSLALSSDGTGWAWGYGGDGQLGNGGYSPANIPIQISNLCVPLTIAVDEITPAPSVSVFPNPTTGMVQLTFSNFKSSPQLLEIYNALGQTVFTTTNLSQTPANIDLSGFLKGIYSVKIYNATETYTQKISVL